MRNISLSSLPLLLSLTLSLPGTTRAEGNLKDMKVSQLVKMLSPKREGELQSTMEAIEELGKRGAAAKESVDPLIDFIFDREKLPVEGGGVYDLDFMARATAVTALEKIAVEEANARRVNQKMIGAIRNGGCRTFRKEKCSSTFVAECKSRPHEVNAVVHRDGTLTIKPPKPDLCSDCLNCDHARIGNAYHSALGWFGRRPEFFSDLVAELRHGLATGAMDRKAAGENLNSALLVGQSAWDVQEKLREEIVRAILP
mgnify:CR=1 FL=1